MLRDIIRSSWAYSEEVAHKALLQRGKQGQ